MKWDGENKYDFSSRPLLLQSVLVCITQIVFSLIVSLCVVSGTDFSLRDMAFGDPVPPHMAAYRTEMGLPHRDYSVSVGSDADTETDGIISPEHAVRLWGRSNTKSGRSSCLSSRANSNLTLTDTEHENTENGEFKCLYADYAVFTVRLRAVLRHLAQRDISSLAPRQFRLNVWCPFYMEIKCDLERWILWRFISVVEKKISHECWFMEISDVILW